ncbi:MAG: SoxR reducing system RseC family protein [Pseudomonadales bacterium]|nr:SoxR reducing system RseC family protein [Pseudomonadales bacterium]NRA16305.1 SoxR reducing system RseC family protein [Oceanospirillaceae bacterium]
MIEEQALVVAVESNQILVETSRNSACGKCSASNDCGQSAIAQWAAAKMINIPVSNPDNLSITIGDTVVVGIDEQSFVRASILLYLLPLVMMFTIGLIVTAADGPEWQVITASFSALVLSFYLIRIFCQKYQQDANYQLVVLKIVV